MGGFDNAEVVKEEGDAAGLAEGARLKYITNLRRGAITAIGEAFDDHRDFVWREPLVGDQLEADLFLGLSGALLDGALDGVLVARGLLRLFDGGVKARVQVRGRAAEFGRDHDFAD